MSTDEHYMLRCIELAKLGAGSVSPNPMVGCVIVHQDQIIGEGWHQRFGEAHAEVNAIASVRDKSILESASVYVSLEPCSHFGKTPPCADLLIRYKVKEVIVGMIDPFSAVAGSGIRGLRDAGIAVRVGVLEQKCQELNKRFVTFHKFNRPYIILKWAQTQDRKIAPEINHLSQELFSQKRHITGAIVQILVHKWRGEEDAIMVGTHTVITDNPELNTRAYPSENPLRFTIDKEGELPIGRKIFDGNQPTLVFTQNNNLKFSNAQTEAVLIDFSKPVWPQITAELYKRNIQSVIVEGGAHTLNSILESGIWDEAQVFSTSFTMGTGLSAPTPGGKLIKQHTIENSTLTIYQNI